MGIKSTPTKEEWGTSGNILVCHLHFCALRVSIFRINMADLALARHSSITQFAKPEI